MYIKGKKIYIKNKIRFGIFLIIISLFIMIIINSIFLHKVRGYENDHYQTVTVNTGETLWDIVNRYSDGEHDIREEIHHIKIINNLKTSYLFPGQQLKIPKRE
ncbi:cell division suppressor protein YneA [Garciella nitratireducens]|uniref:LysM domain-containing protein n=1 Tax=Garciella nitratireducens DSM 15102 TaxID=1121911 RepID=A0A1T4JVZ3_9FIRM|nr:LysM peptidoglycan-binding domain-containing protein [Garciella nitratireducens]RBP45609.1 LysM domain-containing protein [Garciella nitratireducens]SJZ34237.1 LysM domain-containing protein [Garciella nitratireducens DSM 15102]